MAGLTENGMPNAVAEIVRQVDTFTGAGGDTFTADHTHEGLSPGAYSIAVEGAMSDWPYLFTEAVSAGEVKVPAGWHLEAYTGWCLAVYPEV